MFSLEKTKLNVLQKHEPIQMSF